LWYGVSHILIVIPLYNLFIDARLGDTQITDPRIRASETKKVATTEKLQDLFGFSSLLCTTKSWLPDALIIRN
jgi:hypothetical protein